MKSPSAALYRSAAALELTEKILVEALSIIQSKPIDAAPVTEEEPIVQERVYVPHMGQWGTVQQIYGDGQLIGIMLDSRIFIQTQRTLTSSVEVHIYKEESAKFPLTNTSALQTAETLKTLQLSLF